MDFLERPVHQGIASYVLDEIVSLSKFLAKDPGDLIGMGCMGHIILKAKISVVEKWPNSLS